MLTLCPVNRGQLARETKPNRLRGNDVSEAAALSRTTLQWRRDSEYFDRRELEAQTGQPSRCFTDVLIKELADNALDAAEAEHVTPELRLRTRLGRRGRLRRICIMDNGVGIPPETVAALLDYTTRTSDKSGYRGPTRGAMGNALKTVFGIPFALGCGKPIVIEARGVRHFVRPWQDPGGLMRVEHRQEKVPYRAGTRVLVTVPTAGQECDPASWGRAFALFNPHALVKIRENGSDGNHAHDGSAGSGVFYRPTVAFPGGTWRKFLPTDHISPWWHDAGSLRTLVFRHIAHASQGGADVSLAAFVSQFRGLTEKRKARRVLARFPDGAGLSTFEGQPEQVDALLVAMQEESGNPPSAAVLGCVGEDHFRQCFRCWYGLQAEERFWYRRVAGEVADGVPFVFEVAVGVTRRPGQLFHGLNFSPSFGDPFHGTRIASLASGGSDLWGYGVGGFLRQAHASPGEDLQEAGGPHTAAAIHLICPCLEPLDRAKSRLSIPDAVADAAGSALWRVCAKLYREGERRKRSRSAASSARPKLQDKGPPLTVAIAQVIPEAFEEASGGGQYPVSAHTLFYKVRPRIQKITDVELKSRYFEQKLLPAYQREHGELPGLYYEPRGILYEPHGGREIPLGTRDVEAYEFPWWLFDKILFVEKAGLWPVLKAARLGERYDMAIAAGEGFATVACRALLARADKDRRYQIAVLHDADPYGYNIERTVQEQTNRLPGHQIAVATLGLKLEVALGMGLETETFIRRKALPHGLKLTQLEREYFEGRCAGPKTWIARRIELNSMSAPQLVEYIVSQLQEKGMVAKVIPPRRELSPLVDTLYQEAVSDHVEAALADLLREWQVKEELAEELRARMRLSTAARWIKAGLEEDPYTSWRAAGRAAIDEALDGLNLPALLLEKLRQHV
jgi:hypothetical protein